MVFYKNAKETWLKGYGVIKHKAETIKRIEELEEYLTKEKIKGDGFDLYSLLHAADLIASEALWLVVHQTYAKNIYTDGRPLKHEDFKADPQGHVGGALNMVPAYVGYLIANAITGQTRAWVMEQGHAVAAIDAVNMLADNMHDAHKKRYGLTDKGLSAFAQDFYSYKITKDGAPESPLGSHVNPHTGGGHMEGGYLGFVGLQYPHMPLPGESLVAFLSDGAFEEQRGADWTPRWWRAEDSGLIAPIMIANGRRIDQRTTMIQDGGIPWFEKHLKLHGFDPIVFDGRDPAAFIWTIIEQERRLKTNAAKIHNIENYDIEIPYGIAVAPKGAGFYNEGTNYAHNLPLVDNPHKSEVALERFNSHVAKLFVPLNDITQAVKLLKGHDKSNRVQEKENPVANRDVELKHKPDLPFIAIDSSLRGSDRRESDVAIHLTKKSKNGLPRSYSQGVVATRNDDISPMDAIDEGFLQTVLANKDLRPRIGNPDEMSSNRMDDTLAALKFRVVQAEQGAPESTLGKVITALNEEAISAAAFGNKGGINIVVTYEAFGSKMFGQCRQEVIFSRHQTETGKPAKWLSVPIVLTSNTWENSKNELSHQDPSLAESMFCEYSDISRVVFPADYNSAMATIKDVYNTQGQVWSVVVPKQKSPVIFSKKEAENLQEDGGCNIAWAGFEHEKAIFAIIAIGSYQLVEALKASARLKEKNIPHIVSYIIEPGKFRSARDKWEEAHNAPRKIWDIVLPKNIKQALLATHTRPEVIAGALMPLFKGVNLKISGFINRGGTLSVAGMLFVNKCSWLHMVGNSSEMLGIDIKKMLSAKEINVLEGKDTPDGFV